MALPNLPQPDTTSDGKTSSRWMFLLWQWVMQNSSNSTQNILQVEAFTPRPIPYRVSLNSCDSQNILAGQIFGS